MEEMSLEQGLEEIGHKILVLTRNELYMKMRFMDVALSAFYYVQDFSVDLLATDGETMYFNGQMLGGEYRQNRIGVNRAYLHLVLHCIFRHVFRRNGREELMWNLAADIAVESVIDDRKADQTQLHHQVDIILRQHTNLLHRGFLHDNSAQ